MNGKTIPSSGAVTTAGRKKKKFEWGYLLLAIGIGYIVLMLCVAIYTMIAQSFGLYNYLGESRFTLDFWKGVFNKRFWDSAALSFRVAVLSSLIAMLITYPLAVYLQKQKFGKSIFAIIRIPYFIPALVAAFLIVNVIDYHGIINVILVGLGIVKEPLALRNDDNAIGLIIIQVWKNIPFEMIIMYSAIESIRKDVIDAARNLGANRLRVLTRVIIPITIPSAFMAIIMVFIGIFNDFAISSIAGPLYPTTLAGLMKAYAFSYYDWNTAACVGVMTLVFTILCVFGYTKLQKFIERKL